MRDCLLRLNLLFMLFLLFVMKCHGSWTGVFLGLPLLIAYLLLFQSLYNKRYTNKGDKSRKSAALSVSLPAATISDPGAVVDEKLFSSDMWGKDSIPYWRRNATAEIARKHQ